MSDSEQAILAAWSRLGVAWNVPASRRTPDIEQLIVRTLSHIPANSRLLILTASWLSVYWRCVGRDRLSALAHLATEREQATLGIMLETVDSWLAEPVFPTMLRKLKRMEDPEPLLEMDRQRPALAQLAELEATPLARRWGLWCLPISAKPDAIRPRSWVMRANPSLQIRAAFKGNLRSSILSALEAAGSELTPSQLARECGVTRKAVYQALDDLRFCGVLPELENGLPKSQPASAAAG